VILTKQQSTPHRILAICTLDVMAWKLLLPWFLGLLDAGYEVHIACARSTWFEQLAAYGFHMHNVPLRRRMNPLVHILPLWVLYRLMRQKRFHLVNAHSPIAGAVGRLAAKLARIPLIVYTVHGFYFHDNMVWWKRRGFIVMEWLLGKMTDRFMFVSGEDRQTALREGIAKDAANALTIYNGVDLIAYPPRHSALPRAGAAEMRTRLNIPQDAPVVGIVGRIVKEKGYREFAEMAKVIFAQRSHVYFVVVGDALPSDRDGVVAELRKFVEAAGMGDRFRFTGFTDGVADYLQLMDIFTLPSYREGFPRSVLEAMSTALPVVATDIRGCREAVVHGVTGLLVPPRNATALAGAVSQLLQDPELAVRFGEAGRARAVRLYDQRTVQSLFVEIISRALNGMESVGTRTISQRLKRVFDLMAGSAGLILVAPAIIAVAMVIRVRMGGPALFRQSRAGLRGEEFTLFKFRSMSDLRDPSGRLLPDEERLTKLGAWLRRTSIDELPQLFNVLRGDMSLVGPRPLLPIYLDRYSEFQRRRHEVKPGITGWVQVNGRNSLTWEQKFELDVWYVRHRSLWLDFKILCATLGQVLRRKGISQANHATMPEFLGSSEDSAQRKMRDCGAA